MASGGMNNLTTLIKRLEAATSRLEDIASSSQPADASNTPNEASGTLASGSTVNGTPAPSSPPPTAPLSAAATLPKSTRDLDSVIHDDLTPFAELSQDIGGIVAEQAAAFCQAFRAHRDFLLVASKSKKPADNDSVYRDMAKDLLDSTDRVISLKDKNQGSDDSNHLHLLANGVEMLKWMNFPSMAPDKFVSEIVEGAKFYGNRIYTANRNKDNNHTEWVRSFVKISGALIYYLKQHYPQGLEWNPNGVPAEEALREVKAGSPSAKSTAALSASRGAAPPPPPPPPPPAPPQLDIQNSDGNKSEGGGMDAVFSEINKGASVTSGLRKVDQSEMTHKNPNLRGQAPVPTRSDSSSSNGRGKSPQPPAKKQKPESMRQRKPVKKLEGNKWSVENFENEQQTPVEIDAEKTQSILITRCKSSVIKVKGKANAISVDNCFQLGLIVDSLVSAVDAVNSNSFRLQVNGTCPSVQLDKVDNAIIYLSHSSLGTQVYTSKCSSINITLPPPNDDSDSVECPVPEQILSTVVDGKLVSEIVKQE